MQGSSFFNQSGNIPLQIRPFEESTAGSIAVSVGLGCIGNSPFRPKYSSVKAALGFSAFPIHKFASSLNICATRQLSSIDTRYMT